jgi:transposase-like protein
MKPSGNAVCAFGQMYANERKHRRPKTGDKWHLAEVYLKIKGKTHSLWSAVDQYGNVLEFMSFRTIEPQRYGRGKAFLPSFVR